MQGGEFQPGRGSERVEDVGKEGIVPLVAGGWTVGPERVGEWGGAGGCRVRSATDGRDGMR